MAKGFFPADAGFWQGFWYVAQVLNPKLSSYEITKLWSGEFSVDFRVVIVVWFHFDCTFVMIVPRVSVGFSEAWQRASSPPMLVFWQGFWYVAQGMPSRSDGMPCGVVVGGVFASVLTIPWRGCVPAEPASVWSKVVG